MLSDKPLQYYKVVNNNLKAVAFHNYAPVMAWYVVLCIIFFFYYDIVPTHVEKMLAELANLNHCAVPFLSRAVNFY